MPRNTRQFVLGAIAVVLAGVVAVYYFTRSPAGPAPTGDVTLDGICLACQQDVMAHYKVGEEMPALCPKCGERAVYDAFYCSACKLRVIRTWYHPARASPRTYR